MQKTLISVAEARQLIIKHTDVLNPVVVPLSDAAGHALADNVYSKTDVPPFNQSNMDGYAINFDGWKKYEHLKIEGSVPAGTANKMHLRPENAIRIFTGAAVPEGADTVVMQEKIQLDNNLLIIEEPELIKGSNLRVRGSDVKLGELALEKHTILSPAILGFLAGIGIHELSVYPNPRITVILTGDELQQPGNPLEHGQVYEANSFSLRAALNQAGINKVNILSSEDTLETLTQILKTALSDSDLIILTGGVSVGDYDFVIQAAEANQVQQIFHKIKQKPGKPLYFGKKQEKLVFGLPGNPGSVLNCFYEYVLPAIGILSKRETSLKSLHVPLKIDLKKPTGLTHFLKGFFDGTSAGDLKGQESFRLSAFTKANCLIKLEEEKTEYLAGEIVEIHLLPA